MPGRAGEVTEKLNRKWICCKQDSQWKGVGTKMSRKGDLSYKLLGKITEMLWQGLGCNNNLVLFLSIFYLSV